MPIRIRINVANENLQDGLVLQEHLLEKFIHYKDLLEFDICPMLGYSNTEKNDMVRDLYSSVLEYDNTERLKRNRQLSSSSPIISAFAVGTPARPIYSHCYAHNNNLTVDPYGYIYTCLAGVGKEFLAAGKYYPSIEFKEHSIFNRNIDKIDECKDCIYAFLCGGGCPLVLRDYSNLFKPACNSIKSQIHELLPQLYKAEMEHQQKVAI